MIEHLPWYVSVTFILTAFLTVGFLIYAIRHTPSDSIAVKILLFLNPFWLIFQAIIGIGGFYQIHSAVPPRIFAFGVLPVVALIGAYFILFRSVFIEHLPIKVLTLLHVVRIPVEIVLFWLHQNGLVPEVMTFEGNNFDILSGVSAPIVYWFAFRGGRVNRPVLIVWNILALVLLVNIVTTAVLAFPGPMQQIAFDQPNLGVTYFPFVWLPSVIVPAVLFAHLAALYKLSIGRMN